MASPLTFPGAWSPAAVTDDATMLAHGLLDPWTGSPTEGWTGVCDGERFSAERSSTGAYRFFHGERTLLELSADHRRLTGDLSPATRDLRWWRALLDSVLFTVSLLRGRDCLHAGAVRVGDGVVAIAGPSGAGKSTLLAYLTSIGFELVSDDILCLSDEASDVLAHPGPPVMTVPRAASGERDNVLGAVGSELWLKAPVISEPLPLRRIVVLDRYVRPGAAPAAQRETAAFPVLMQQLLNFPRTPERAATRLTLASRTSASVELVRLRAHLTCPVEDVARLALSPPPAS